MILAISIIVIVLIMSMLYAGSSRQERTRRALNDDLHYTMLRLTHTHREHIDRPRLLLPGPHEEPSDAPYTVTIIRSVEHETRGIVHLLKLTLARPGLVHEDLELTLGAPPDLGTSNTYTGELFNGERLATVLFRQRWRFSLPRSTTMAALLDAPTIESFSAPHTNLPLRTCVITHQGVTLIVEVPQDRLEHPLIREESARQQFLARHFSHLFSLVSQLKTTPLARANHLFLQHIFGKPTEFELSQRARETLLDLLFESSDEATLANTWHRLFSMNRPLDLIHALAHVPDKTLELMPEEQLVELLLRAHMTLAAQLMPILPHIITHLPMTLLADETIDFDFKFVLLTTWLKHPDTPPSALQQAIRDMILAHPFERQRIQRHVTSTPGLQHGSLSLSHGLPNGNISIIPEQD